MLSIKFGKWQGGLCVSVVVGILSFGSIPVIAGPFGAAGDLYVSTKEDYRGLFNISVVKQFDGATGAYVGTFATSSGGQIMGMAWSPNGNLFLASSANFAGLWDIREFDGQTGAELGIRYTNPADGLLSVGKGLAFGPNGDLFVGDLFKGEILRLDGTSYGLLGSYSGISSPQGMAFSPDGNLMVISGSFAGTGSSAVLEYDVSGAGIVPLGLFGTYPGSAQSQTLAYGPDSNLYVTGGMAGGVGKFDGTTGAFLGDFVALDQDLPTNGLVFDDDGRMLVSIVNPPSNTGGKRIDSFDSMTGAYLGEFVSEGAGDMTAPPTVMSIKPVPEPASLVLLLVGGLLVASKRRGWNG